MTGVQFCLTTKAKQPGIAGVNCKVNYSFISCVNPSDLCLSLQTGSAQRYLDLLSLQQTLAAASMCATYWQCAIWATTTYYCKIFKFLALKT